MHIDEHDISHLRLTATVGRRKFRVTSWQQVSDAYVSVIDTLNVGASRAPSCLITGPDGKVAAHVAYNGKVFAGHPAEWRSGQQPICWPSH